MITLSVRPSHFPAPVPGAIIAHPVRSSHFPARACAMIAHPVRSSHIRGCDGHTLGCAMIAPNVRSSHMPRGACAMIAHPVRSSHIGPIFRCDDRTSSAIIAHSGPDVGPCAPDLGAMIAHSVRSSHIHGCEDHTLECAMVALNVRPSHPSLSLLPFFFLF